MMADRYDIWDRFKGGCYIAGWTILASAFVAWCAVKAEGREVGNQWDMTSVKYDSAPRSYTRLSAKRGRSDVSLNGVVAPLAAKAREIQRDCGSKVVSARAPRGNKSNHPIGRAVDMRGNPRCIYDKLKGWPGGVSTDYASAPGGPHVHISYNPGGQEWGLRFAHHRSSKRVRLAKRTREASAQ